MLLTRHVRTLAQDSTNVTPLLFLLDHGCDPTRDIEAFADDMLFLDKLVVVESRASTVSVMSCIMPASCHTLVPPLLVMPDHLSSSRVLQSDSDASIKACQLVCFLRFFLAPIYVFAHVSLCVCAYACFQGDV
jgi:hypothetical protein